MLTHSLNFFIAKRRNLRLTPFLLVKLSVVISTGGSVCCNYATDLCIYGNYANDNVCCILAGFQVLLSITGMLVDFSVTIMQVTVSVAVVQLGFCSTYAGDSFCSKYVFDSFYGNYADGSLCCNYAGVIFCSALCM